MWTKELHPVIHFCLFRESEHYWFFTKRQLYQRLFLFHTQHFFFLKWKYLHFSTTTLVEQQQYLSLKEKHWSDLVETILFSLNSAELYFFFFCLCVCLLLIYCKEHYYHNCSIQPSDKRGLGSCGDVLKEQLLQLIIFYISSFCGMTEVLGNQHNGFITRLTLNHFFSHRYHF